MTRAPVRFSLRDTPARDRDDLYREFFGRAVMHYEVERSREVPFDIDVNLQMLPGLLMVSGKMHGSHNCRTRELMADGLDDLAMALNLGGKYVVRQDDQEIALAAGEATLFSLGKLCNLMHWPPGGLLAMRFPRAQIVRRVGDADRICMRPIRAGTQALKLLASYVGIAQDRETVADFDLQQTFSNHVYDLIALSVGATREAADAAQGLRAARMHAIKQDIAGHLAAPHLSIAALAQRHNCTPRHIQRLFGAEATTFTDYVLEQRLARAYRLLTDRRTAARRSPPSPMMSALPTSPTSTAPSAGASA